MLLYPQTLKLNLGLFLLLLIMTVVSNDFRYGQYFEDIKIQYNVSVWAVDKYTIKTIFDASAVFDMV